MTDKEGSLKEISDKLGAINETLKKTFVESKEPKKNEEREFQLQMLRVQLIYGFIASIMTILFSAAISYIVAIITISVNLPNQAALSSIFIVFTILLIASIVGCSILVVCMMQGSIAKLRNEKVTKAEK